ncbi:MAG: hypothetical protein GQ507_03410, partial [Dehalococcoidales bacterium]|nr:hypothetical protein [Dehalococcoidales bacterium]
MTLTWHSHITWVGKAPPVSFTSMKGDSPMSKAEFTCAEFYNTLNEKKLMGTRCKECHTLHLPPRRICPNCHSTSVEWFPMKGEGK